MVSIHGCIFQTDYFPLSARYAMFDGRKNCSMKILFTNLLMSRRCLNLLFSIVILNENFETCFFTEYFSNEDVVMTSSE